jgi:hypothetical protein
MTTAPVLTEVRKTGSSDARALSDTMAALAVRMRGEYKEMPGLRLTLRQAARLFGIPPDVAGAVLHELRRASVLALSSDGAFSLIAEPSHWRSAGANDPAPGVGKEITAGMSSRRALRR